MTRTREDEYDPTPEEAAEYVEPITLSQTPTLNEYAKSAVRVIGRARKHGWPAALELEVSSPALPHDRHWCDSMLWHISHDGEMPQAPDDPDVTYVCPVCQDRSYVWVEWNTARPCGSCASGFTILTSDCAGHKTHSWQECATGKVSVKPVRDWRNVAYGDK